MTRFFFDYTTKGQQLFDYRGDEFRNEQCAIEFAEAIAQDLFHCLAGDWHGWTIEVRDPNGIKLFSVPVEDKRMAVA
jgi:hypothetical protein